LSFKAAGISLTGYTGFAPIAGRDAPDVRNAQRRPQATYIGRTDRNFMAMVVLVAAGNLDA
jgi:hypothetical protein